MQIYAGNIKPALMLSGLTVRIEVNIKIRAIVANKENMESVALMTVQHIASK